VAGTYSVEDVLPRMARIIAEGTGATRAEVWLRVRSEIRREATWPKQEQAPPPPVALSGDELPPISGSDEAIPVRHQGELLGAIAVSMPPSEPLTPPQERLLQDLAAQAGLVLRNVGLTADLRARLEELRASRQRLVTAQDEERRRIERNLHDGAQQQLVALAVRLRMAGMSAERESAPTTREMLQGLQADAQASLETLRDLARGIYPPLLADQGLTAALEAQARKAPVPVAVEANMAARHSQDAEAAVYFCCLEALQNAAKYAPEASVTITLSERDGELTFSVRDTGPGFDPSRTPRGSGLQNMADRLAVLGGAIEIGSAPGEGTTVTGRLPVRSLEPVA
jgi:signal transduction histidine kinase